MKRSVRLTLVASVLAALAAPVATASAETYPSRTVRLVVPFGAGGPADVFARVLAQHMSEELKQSFVV
jgi:tripartite-type tricarboxylate transporter receptor subunit TctC